MASKSQSIKILCTYTELIPFDKLEDFQGKLKAITRENLERLKASLREGIKFPKNVWRHDGKDWIVNGHQTKRALLELRDEGWKLPAGMPCVFVTAKDRKEAKRALLQADSRYSKIMRRGFQAFISDMDSLALSRSVVLPEMAFTMNSKPERPDVEFTEELLEEHNYVVLYFDNKVDWLQAVSILGIESKKNLDPDLKHTGVGRVVNGALAIKRIQETARSSGPKVKR